MTTGVLAIDPGPVQSAWLILEDGKPVSFGICPNDDVRAMLRIGGVRGIAFASVVIEEIASYGMAVGAEIFATVHWSGRFHEAAVTPVVLLPRLKVKQHLCHDSRAKDANIRQALIDRFGGSAAIGTTKARGPLYGISKDVWSALAIAVTYCDTVGSASRGSGPAIHPTSFLGRNGA